MLPARVGRILEIGYGSGIVLPEYAARCSDLHGIDPHPYNREVTAALARHSIPATLVCGTAEVLPYAAGFFDRVVAVSAMEFIPDLAAACLEIVRVLAPDGRFLVVTPGHSRIVDLGLKLLTGISANQDYGDRRRQLLPTLLEYFRPLRDATFPPLVGAVVPLYRAFELVPHIVTGEVGLER